MRFEAWYPFWRFIVAQRVFASATFVNDAVAAKRIRYGAVTDLQRLCDGNSVESGDAGIPGQHIAQRGLE
ncbi:MAG: hypothetical protein M3Y22_11940, partial [Pseudomonadota bacterium]|nr:hypothetical protein [Pseudomonadota bacterium]